MDNYFILSSKVGDKWKKVTFDMKSVNLGTCIHIMGKVSLEGDSGGRTYEQKIGGNHRGTIF